MATAAATRTDPGRCAGCNTRLDGDKLGVAPYWEPPFSGVVFCEDLCWPALVERYDAEGWPARPEGDLRTRLEREDGKLSAHETIEQRDKRFRAWAAWRRRVLEEVNSGRRQFSDNLGVKPGNVDEEVLRALDREFPVEPPDAEVLRPNFGGVLNFSASAEQPEGVKPPRRKRTKRRLK